MNLALRCTVCECLLKDSLTWVDHINGRKHNRFLGMTMQVEQKSPAETYAIGRTSSRLVLSSSPSSCAITRFIKSDSAVAPSRLALIVAIEWIGAFATKCCGYTSDHPSCIRGADDVKARLQALKRAADAPVCGAGSREPPCPPP